MKDDLWVLHLGGDRGSLCVPKVTSCRVAQDGDLVLTSLRDGVIHLERTSDWEEAARYVRGVRVVVAQRMKP